MSRQKTALWSPAATRPEADSLSGPSRPHREVDLDDLIALVNARTREQHGLIRIEQVPQQQRRRLRRLADRGVLIRLTRGVYRIGGAPTTWMQSLTAGVWALGPTAVVSHAAAAQLHHLDGYESDAVEFTVDRRSRSRAVPMSGATVHTTTFRASADRVNVSGLPTTSAVRTILDLARSGVTTVRLEAAIDSAILKRLITLDRIADRLSNLEGSARWGVARLDALIVTSGGHTLLERRFLQLVRRASLPMPQPRVVHRRDGRHIARVDFLFPERASWSRFRAEGATRRRPSGPKTHDVATTCRVSAGPCSSSRSSRSPNKNSSSSPRCRWP